MKTERYIVWDFESLYHLSTFLASCYAGMSICSRGEGDGQDVGYDISDGKVKIDGLRLEWAVDYDDDEEDGWMSPCRPDCITYEPADWGVRPKAE